MTTDEPTSSVTTQRVFVAFLFAFVAWIALGVFEAAHPADGALSRRAVPLGVALIAGYFVLRVRSFALGGTIAILLVALYQVAVTLWRASW